MSSINQPLKYLFTAVYDDGSTFVQPENDQSKDHVEGAEWNPSSYRDIDMDRLVQFYLVGAEHTYMVDLIDGHYEIDDVPFIAQEQQFRVNQKLQLIFFREVQREIDRNTNKEISAKVSRYFIGWKTEEDDTKGTKSMIGIV